MARVEFVTYGKDGRPLRKGICHEGDLPRQLVSGESGIVRLPEGADVITELDMDKIEAALLSVIDAKADAAVARGQRPIYARKLAEAKAGKGALLEAEAKARGIEPKALAAQIKDKAQEQLGLQMIVELARVTAKHAIRQADSLGAAAQAADAAAAEFERLEP